MIPRCTSLNSNKSVIHLFARFVSSSQVLINVSIMRAIHIKKFCQLMPPKTIRKDDLSQPDEGLHPASPIQLGKSKKPICWRQENTYLWRGGGRTSEFTHVFSNVKSTMPAQRLACIASREGDCSPEHSAGTSLHEISARTHRFCFQNELERLKNQSVTEWAITGSNCGHPACKAGALPLS